MKNLTSITELIVIVILAVIIVTPEIVYSLLLRARDKIEMMVKELVRNNL